MKKLLISAINFYQTFLSFDRGVLSYLTPGGACKYPTTCSEFAKQAIQKYGVLLGVRMGIERLVSCR